MKVLLIYLTICFSALAPKKGFAQMAEAQQLLLNVEKLAQFKQILSDMKKGYQILEGGYNTVKDISQGNFKLHKAFLDGLYAVSPSVRNYRRVGEIINYQLILVREYRSFNERFQQDGNFSPQELEYMARVYGNLLKGSFRNLDELTNVVTAGTLRMSDDERLQAIDRIYEDMSDKLNFLRNFNNETRSLGIIRAKEKNEVDKLRKLYGIN